MQACGNYITCLNWITEAINMLNEINKIECRKCSKVKNKILMGEKIA